MVTFPCLKISTSSLFSPRSHCVSFRGPAGNQSCHFSNFRADQTQMGHILGAAAQRSVESVPERQLSAVECALLRFLTHAALYLGASNSAQVAVLFSLIR